MERETVDALHNLEFAFEGAGAEKASDLFVIEHWAAITAAGVPEGCDRVHAGLPEFDMLAPGANAGLGMTGVGQIEVATCGLQCVKGVQEWIFGGEKYRLAGLGCDPDH